MVGNNNLKITILNGYNLIREDEKQQIQAYCLLQLGRSHYKTKCVDNDANLAWNEEVWFNVVPGYEVLSLSVWNKKIPNDDVMVGSAFVDIGRYKNDETAVVNVQLMGAPSSNVNLNVLPFYTTAATQMEEMGRKVKRLILDNNAYRGKIDQLNTQIGNLSTENRRLHDIGKFLEKDGCMSVYGMLSCQNGTLGSANVTPKTDKDFSESNGLSRGKRDHLNDQFDVITEKDITQLLSNNSVESENDETNKVVSIPPKINLDERILTLDDWGRHLSESINVLDGEIMKLSHREKVLKKLKNRSYFDKSVGLKLLLENIELAKTLIELEVDDNHLNDLVSQIKNHGVYNSRIRMDKIDQIIDGKIAEEADTKISDAMASLDVSSLEVYESGKSFHEVTTPKSEFSVNQPMSDLDTDWCEISVDKRQFVSSEKMLKRLSEDGFDEGDSETLASNMSADMRQIPFNREFSEKDKTRISSEGYQDFLEYFWDDFLPKSIGRANVSSVQENHGSDDDVMFEELDNMAHGVRENVDEFIKNNYNLNTEEEMRAKMESNQSLWTEIEEEAQHFKDINIRLIKENEELVDNLHALEKQIYNLDRMQQILFHQLNMRVPVGMKNILNKMYELYDTCDGFEEDEEENYAENLVTILNQMIDGKGQNVDVGSAKKDGCLAAVSLLYHDPLSP